MLLRPRRAVDKAGQRRAEGLMSAEREGAERWQEKMRRMEGAADLRRVDTELPRAVTDLTRQNFVGQRGPTGAWPARKARRSAEPVTRPLLQKSGRLRRSVTERGAEGS